ncbi:MAG: DUF3108 domain-containing protein [Candidatus Omnitrophica bacterium]|nr:DUF3108 domain-containing protein [Candidatus Omnitrophota bacterium]
MMRFKFLLIFLMISFSSFALAAEPAFKSGETIRYTVKQGFLKVGNATLEFKGETTLDGKTLDLIVFTAKGIGFFDEERIYIDPVSFLPFRVIRTLDIPGERSKIQEDYFPDQELIQVTKEMGGKTTVQKIEKKGAVDNIYGFIYRYRLKADLKSVDVFEVNLPTVDVKIKKVKEVEFNAGSKMYRAALMRSVPEKYSIWFDVSEKRLPLRIAGAIGMANTVMTMLGVDDK